MKKNLCVVFLIACLLALFVSCQDKTDEIQFGSLSVKVEEAVSRTIEPLTVNLTCARYKVTGVHSSYATNQNSVYRFETDITDSSTLNQLIVGQWSIIVEGFNSDGIKIMESEAQTVNIVADQVTEKTFVLSYLTSGTGILSLTIKIPASLSIVASIDLTVGGGEVVSLTDYTTEGSYKFFNYEEAFSVGDYALNLVFKNSEGRQVGFSQSDRVHIYANLTSAKMWTNPGVAEVPTFSTADTTVLDGTTISLATATSGASIYYTVDGSSPSARNTKYSADNPITLDHNMTVKALAVHPSLFNSDVASMTFLVKANVPQTNVTEALYTEFKNIELTSTTTGASIYYTIDDESSNPSQTHGTLYSGAISVEYSQTIKAIAVKDGLENSDVVSFAYVIKVPAPQFSTEGTMDEGETVTITCAMEGAEIRYTTDGSTPTLSSTRYTGPITIQGNQIIKAIAVKLGCTNSDVATASYSVTANPVTFSVGSGTYSDTQSVVLSSETDDAVIYYTTDGSDPTSASTLYTGPVAVDRNMTVKAIATKSGQNDSAVTSASYEIKIATPAFSVAPGSFNSVQSITLSCATSGVSYYYTVDGTTPTTLSTLYNSSIEVSSTRTIKVIATRSGCTSSEVLSGQFVINTGSGSIVIVNPTHYTLSIEMPAGWTEFVPVIKGVCANLTAVLSPASETATYTWYVDGERVTKAADGNTLKLGTLEPNNVYLFEGLHIVSVEATVDGRTYEESIYVSVSDNASIGTAGANGYGVGARGPSGGYIFYDCDEDDTEDDPDGADNLTSSICGWRYLEAAPEDINVGPMIGDDAIRNIGSDRKGYAFGLYNPSKNYTYDQYYMYINGTSTYNSTNCTRTEIGSGLYNTELLVAVMQDRATADKTYHKDTEYYAANVCYNYSLEVDGHIISDWFLPSKDELNQVYTNLYLNDPSSFDTSESYYWSSSEYDSNPRAAWYQYFLSGRQDWGDGKSSRKSVRPIRAFTVDEPYGHSFASVVTQAPTCTEIGFCTYTCQDCGFSYVGAIPSEHYWTSDDICSVCGTDRYPIGSKGPAGGYIIYADTMYQDGWRYIEIAPDRIGKTVFGYFRDPNDSSVNVNSDGSTTSGGIFYPDSNSHSSYDGVTNTESIVNAAGDNAYTTWSGSETTSNYAAKLCADYSFGGYDDWYLPSIEEARYIFDNLKGVRSTGSSYFWTSSEASPLNAYYYYCNSNSWSSDRSAGRSNEYDVRPIRRF